MDIRSMKENTSASTFGRLVTVRGKNAIVQSLFSNKENLMDENGKPITNEACPSSPTCELIF